MVPERPQSVSPSASVRRSEPLPVALHRYWIPREQPFAGFLLLSVALFAASVGLAVFVPQEEKLPPMIEVDLGIDGVENEPPPLGEPDAGLGEVQPEPPAPEEPATEPEPAPEPVPEPEPEPEMAEEEPPPPPPEPEFTVPEEKPVPVATPKPKPKAKPPEKPPRPAVTDAPRPSSNTRSAPTGSGEATGRAGTRGSPTGQPGGRGGGRGDFISTPHPQYDATARQRRYEGRGVFLITYVNGRIATVSVQQSTGVPYLDARTISWIKSRWRVKAGASGYGRLPITWRLK